MSDGQLDLFSRSGVPPPAQAPPVERRPRPVPAELDDADLLAAIPASVLTDGPLLAAEAGRRGLAAAIPILEDYCRRFAGFGMQRALPEQIAALNALAAIGGPEAALGVARIIDRGWVQGPTLATAVAAATQLGSHLPAQTVLALLRHADPAIRGNACRLARAAPDVITTLVDLLGDLRSEIRLEAACALARMGHAEAAPLLKQALREAASRHVIEAIPPIADDECIVLLGRTARASPDMAVAALDALEAIEAPLAARLLERLRE
ncbi:MAG TPA: HEAT repeat domain-containing protein [Acetobacteraceae bacterium]